MRGRGGLQTVLVVFLVLLLFTWTQCGVTRGVSTASCTAQDIANNQAELMWNLTTATSTATAMNAVDTLFDSAVSFSDASTFYVWSFNTNTCTSKLENIGVSLLVPGPSGSSTVEVFENPAGTTVDRVNVTEPLSAEVYALWAGFQWPYESGYQDTDFYYINSVTDPYGCGSADNCMVAQWVGLTVEQNGGNGIDQDGSLEQIQTSNGQMTFTYYAWYEFYTGSNSYLTDCFGILPGAEMTPTVWYNPNNELYYQAVEDFSTHTSCTSSASMSMGSPKYVSYIGEDPVVNNAYNPVVPDFGTITFWGVSSPYEGIENPDTWWNDTGYPTGHGHQEISLWINGNNDPGCYDSECFALSWYA